MHKLQLYKWPLLVGLLLCAQAGVLLLYGQPPICTCGDIKLWEGVVLGPGNSQHLTDWYTFSHIIHGFLFYGLLRLLFPRIPLVWRLLIALGIEISWELLENTPTVIEHYRQQALAQGYTGDSILNSVADTLAMVGGFWLAYKFPAKIIVAVAICLEIFTLVFIKDSLLLNIINLIYPLEFISNWQSS